jgi:hypothetical protein
LEDEVQIVRFGRSDLHPTILSERRCGVPHNGIGSAACVRT